MSVRPCIRVMVLCLTALVCVAWVDIPLMAQFDSATLTGIVTDSSNSTVPLAVIKAVNEATNIESSTTTDTEGRFTFSNLRPGTYSIKFTA